MTNISWTDATWNPITGCSKVSEGCLNCYAERLATTWPALKRHYTHGFKVVEHPERLGVKFGRNPKKIFVADMGDLFHPEISPTFLQQIIGVIKANPQHIFQLLTKRAERLGAIKSYPNNVWLGVTVESPKYLDRIEYLAATDAEIKFVSAEPLLEGFKDYLWLKKIDWLIVGGESGPGRRAFDPQWARDLLIACAEHGVAFWFKQHGAKKPGDELLDGELAQEWPNNNQTTLDLAI